MIDHPPPRSALLVIAHGSPRAAANDDLYRVLEECRSRGAYTIVQEAFLECNDPAIPAAIALCAESGAKAIVAVPYFLHTGKHEANDIPTLLEEAMVAYPAIRFRMGRNIGSYPEMTDILLKRLENVVGKALPLPQGEVR
jgi:sirohydrochlorin ferrochelatase